MFFVIMKTGQVAFIDKKQTEYFEKTKDYVFFDEDRNEEGVIMIFEPALVSVDATKIIFAEHAQKVEAGGSVGTGGAHVN